MNELYKAIRRVLEELESQVHGEIQPSYLIKTETLVNLMREFEAAGEVL